MYIKGSLAAARLGVCSNTLRKMADDGRIQTIRISGQRRYDVDGYLGQNPEITVCYCRVSSYKQKSDLDRQISFMQERFPNAEIIKDIASGLNFKRKGLNSILERAMRGDKLRLVVAHRDRLARFGFDLIKFIIEANSGRFLVLSEDALSPAEELTKDLLNILHVFSCRMHGLGNYKSQVRQALSEENAEASV